MKNVYEESLIFLHRIVNAFPEFLTGLEVWNMLARQGYRVTCFRITTGAWWAVMQGETAKPAYFNTLATRQRIAHLLQHGLDGKFDILAGQMTLLSRDDFDQF